MIAHKFLAQGAVSPTSRLVWPTPSEDAEGDWIEATGPLTPCARGVHVCRSFDLAYWLNHELWEIETDGECVQGFDCLVVRRARLRRRVTSWSDGGAAGFAAACVEHATELAGRVASLRTLVDDARSAANDGHVAVSAYCAAMAVARLRGPTRIDISFREERAWQGEWIARELLDS
jgi:hypothetical protein